MIAEGSVRVVAVAAAVAGIALIGGGSASAAEGVVAAASETRSAASCAAVIRWRGVLYDGYAVQVSPLVGRRLGRAFYPPCDDTPSSGSPAVPEPTQVRAMRGVSPRDVLVEVGRNDGVYVRASLDRLPDAVRRLQRPPRCESSTPLRLVGPWLGILAANGETEDDLVPPYDLSVHVRWASQTRYERAFLKIRATRHTQGLITREDVDTALVGNSGDLWATVRCVRGRYVAVRLDARPT